MSFPPRRPSRPVLRRRRRGAALPTILILVGVVIAVMVGARITADVWWFDELGFLSTFTTKLWLQIVLFVVGGGLLAAAVAVSLTIGYRSRPVYAPVSTEQAGLDRYRESLEPLRRVVVIVLSVAAGLFGGSVAMSRWQTLLLWWNRVDFGTKDQQFQMDQGFYVFSLPWFTFLVSFLTAAVVLAGIGGLAAHYLYGGLRLSGGGDRTTRAARIHLASLAAAFLLLRAVGYWLDRYEVMTSSSGYVTGVVGPTYTDANAVLPAKAILALIAIVVALLFVAAAVGSSWRLPAIGTGLLVVSAIAIGGIYPWAVQKFQVTPNRQSLESDFVKKNIDATRDAYDLSDVEVSDYAANTTATQGQLSSDAQTIPSVRLLDPAVVGEAFQQTQGQRGYYKFGDTLDVDRYATESGTQDAVVAARELNLAGLAPNQRTWVNEHTIYTHGYGVVVAQGNSRAPDGSPSYLEANVPTTGDLGLDQPRIYFGEGTTDYSVVGGKDNEIDYPDGSATGFATTKYDGSGGVAVGNLLQKLVYGLKFGDQNLLLSSSVTADSKILYDRTPRERVEKVAPWLTMDGDAYPSIVDGRVVWILDGYTTSSSFPYAAATELGDATTDALTQSQGSSVQALQDRTVNYVRNSVKATVDAYTGKVSLYEWDDTDPVLKAWMKAFPDAVKPLADVDESLMQHLRYPQDMFKVQREVLEKYHVTDPSSFLTGQDFWNVPADPTVEVPTGATRPKQPPYYLTLAMPDQQDPTFSLTTTYVPASNANTSGTQVLRGFVAVDSNAGAETGVKNAGYGKIRLLELPQSTTINGPVQIQNNINSDTAVADQVRLLTLGGGSTVKYGNLLTLPVGGGLLYVEPIYAQSTGDNSFPRLSRVVAVFGDTIAIDTTLDGALKKVFGGNAGATAGDAGTAPSTGATPTGTPTAGATGTPTGSPTGSPTTGDPATELQQALDTAKQAIQDSSAALASGDFTKYGEAQQRLTAAVNAASEAQNRLEGGDGSSPSASPSSSAAPPDPTGTPTP
ncbi:UPF0182 family protein [Kineococcus sp. GCM10028916]|uniref:UPF0182 family membrane protein n=1 Tax=Kineococcus sp. GCM10028916 TaxID=3273394 RepID=UPI003634895D